jgi:hypothetical protein
MIESFREDASKSTQIPVDHGIPDSIYEQQAADTGGIDFLFLKASDSYKF